MATYYVDPDGSNTAPYDTWAKAATKPSTLINTNPAGGPHTVYINAGNYDDAMSITNAAWDGSTWLGMVGQIFPAGEDGVVVKKASNHSLRCQRANVTMKNITFGETGASWDCFYYDGSNFVGEKLRFVDSGRNSLNAFNGSNFLFVDCVFSGSSGSTPISVAGTGSGSFKKSVFCPSQKQLFGNITSSGAVIRNNASGIVYVDNCIIFGVDGQPLYNSSTGSLIVRNSIVCAGDVKVGLVVAGRDSGTLSISNSILIASWRYPGVYFGGTVGDVNNIKLNSPRWISHARRGYIIPCVDDNVNDDYAIAVSALLESKRVKGTWYVDASGIDANLSNIQAVRDGNGMDIGFHGYSNTKLNFAGTIFTVTKSATVNIDRTADTITVAPGGTVSGFKSKRLDAIKTELEALGCTVSAINSDVAVYALGELLTGTAGAQSAASGLAVPVLIDTTCATGLFKSEIADALATIESALGISLTTMATPMGATSQNVQDACVSVGLHALRSGDTASDANWRLNNVNLYRLLYIGTGQITGANDDETRGRIRAISTMAAQTGALIAIVGHNTTEISLEKWALICDTLAENPDVTVTSMEDAVNAIRTSGDWATTDEIIYTRTWADQSDYHLLPTSPCIGAGIDVGLTTDLDGNAIPGALGYDIGPYSYMPGWAPFDGSMPALTLSPDCPGKLKQVQEWRKVASAKEIGKY